MLTVNGGEEAIEAYKTNINKTCCKTYFKLIFMDLNMPIVDGFTACKTILSINEEAIKRGINIPRVIVLAMTAYANTKNRNLSEKVGM
mmetsp:Transcript_22713/g.16091  ORF Transcript_22713/g.16091 Transcript_22713/m.16091 type:complete len:88 (+) Transcript_22713:277-540(+)